MKRTVLAGILLICLLLPGCGLFDGTERVWMEPHPIPQATVSQQDVSAGDYAQLYSALGYLVESGTKQANIFVGRYDQQLLYSDMQRAMETIRVEHPLAAYAVSDITYTPGIQSNERVLVVNITYSHNEAELKKIKTVANDAAAAEAVHTALSNCEYGIVLLVQDYREQDFTQVVTDFALQYPEQVMETPQVTENVYPDHGSARVVELKFQYQNGRDTLRNMQTQVENLFKSAVFFVSSHQSQQMRYARLYTWLMETNEYTVRTSVTPAYSLLLYGVGDSKAFASVFASLCRRMDLECMVISGTKNGESWHWNLVRLDGAYYHLDLLQCRADGMLSMKTDSQMGDYVWDYGAYPRSEGVTTE